MKFVTIRDLRGRPGQVWKKLAEGRELVLTSNGKPIALLSPVTEESFERDLAALRRARLAETIRSIQKESKKRFPRGVSLATINAEIAAVRAKRER
ncbi:MAG TPA: type II toxin-antitoxin system Phd/YefM family antitoxin [Thermoanaerobaculia bacterium]|nr:type II toxin-antitoxin system Phd/YefM family antitoxin [Thermoanaerobaculia bacterium]